MSEEGLPFDPKNWFWIVGGDESQVFSSKSGNYILASDAGYVAWVASGGMPTRIASAVELGEVLAPHNVRPAQSAVLDSYTETQARKLTLEVVAKILFWAVNEIRVLKGQNPVTANQFKTFLKGLM